MPYNIMGWGSSAFVVTLVHELENRAIDRRSVDRLVDSRRALHRQYIGM